MKNQQKNNYFQQSRSLDIQRTLTPFLSRIRKDNIHCYHQLQSPEHQTQSTSYKPFKVFIPEQISNSIILDTNFRKSSTNNKSRSKNPNIFVHNKTITPQSKLKKHLVEKIDLKQIQKLLYCKKNTKTRFQKFCLQHFSKTARISQHHKQRIPFMHICQPNFPIMDRTNKRTIIKKKFWIKQHFKNNSTQKDDNLLRGISVHRPTYLHHQASKTIS